MAPSAEGWSSVPVPHEQNTSRQQEAVHHDAKHAGDELSQADLAVLVDTDEHRESEAKPADESAQVREVIEERQQSNGEVEDDGEAQ